MPEMDDYRRVERAIAFLDERWQEQPSLEAVAAQVGLSPFHFQRMFHRWAGVSPKRFLQGLTLAHAKRQLRGPAPVRAGREANPATYNDNLLAASLDLGLSGPSRLHDLFVRLEAATPGEYRAAGHGVEIRWGLHDSPFGACALGVTGRGICALGFADDEAGAAAGIQADWPGADLVRDQRATAPWAARVFAGNAAGEGLALFVRATPFQLQVWRALLAVPPGQVTTYQAIARAIGRTPASSRAVGNAVGANPIAWLIPCHRVIRSVGAFGGYRWGRERKRVMLGWEAARAESEHEQGQQEGESGRQAAG
jgi:AraC family transcriptional regulator of adaptative response/methylated-DNA-[protein]-cysteine methyltransferase